MVGGVVEWGDVKVPSHELLGMSDPGKGSHPAKFLPPPGIFFEPTRNQKTLLLHS